MREDLVVINLKYASSSESLVMLAYEELIKKVLVFNAEQQNLAMLGRNIASILGVRSVDDSVMEAAVDNLLAQKKIIKSNSLYSLKKSVKTQISEETQEQDKEKKRVVKTYFPTELGEKQLKNWFNEAVVAFFGAYSDEIISSITRKNFVKIDEQTSLTDLLRPSIDNAGLEKSSEQLISGFESFVNSTSFDDTHYVTSLALALFSARLVAANISADPIALQELTSSSFVLDTNVLITIAIERKVDSATLESLGEVFTEIDGKLFYLPPSKEEYKTVVQQHTEDISSLIEKFPLEVVLDSKGDFISALKSRSVSSKEEAQQFLNALAEDFPPILENAPKIEELLDSDVEKLIERAEKNTKLIDRLIAISRQDRMYTKKPKSAEHDAKLVYAVGELRRGGENVRLLTTDRTLMAYSEEVTTESEKPYIMSFEALLSLLAVREAGTSVAGKRYGALLAQMIRNRCIPSKKTYRPEDLQYMVGISEKVLELKSGSIKKIANTVFRQSQQVGEKGKDNYVRLTIDREFRESLNRENARADKLKSNLEEKEKELQRERVKGSEYEIELITREKFKILIKDTTILFLSLALRFAFAALIAGLIYLSIAAKTSVDYDFILNIIFGLIGAVPLIIKPIETFKYKHKKLERRAKKSIQKKLSKKGN